MSEQATTEATDQEQGSEGTASEETASPDFSEALASLEAKIDSLTPKEEKPDLTSALSAEDEPEYEEPEDDPYEYVDPRDQRMDQIVDYLSQKERDERDAQLLAIEEKYDDIGEYVDQIAAQTRALAERYNNESLLDDPELVERIYKSLKAEAAAEAETPAEEARNRGAKLETDASASGPSEPLSPDDEFIENFGKGRNKSVFG